MAVRALKTRMGWISCPKDKVVTLVDHHCKAPLKNCPHFESGVGNGILYCNYEEEEEEVKNG